MKTIVMEKYFFSEFEKAKISSDLAGEIAERRQLELRKKAVNAELMSKLKDFDDRINDLAGKVHAGFEMLVADCDRVPDYERKTWIYTSKRTGEVLDTEQMNDADMQGRLFDTDHHDALPTDAADFIDRTDRTGGLE